MAHTHYGLDQRVLGRLQSDEQFTVRIKHLMKLKNQGKPLQYFCDKYNQIRVKHGNTWYVMDELWESIPELKPEELC